MGHVRFGKKPRKERRLRALARLKAQLPSLKDRQKQRVEKEIATLEQRT